MVELFQLQYVVLFFVGWKAVALISAGVTSLGGAIALGIYNGVNSTK